MLGKRLLTSVAAGVLMAAAGTAGAAVNFDTDVAASIDKGLAWFDAAGCFGGTNGTTFNCDDATGLALLALLEKRPTASGDPQGYAGATTEDQARMRRTVRHVIDSINAQGTSFYSYRDGAYLMALSVYMRSGGPDKDDPSTTELDGASLTLKQALDKAFDRIVVNQMQGLPASAAPWPQTNGYWCYSGPNCRDSSTTQLVVAGLAAARGVYIAGPYADATRYNKLEETATRTQVAYRENGTPGGGCTATPPANEKGHGYNAGYEGNSIQQTASGLWAQLVGGGSLNHAGPQAYLNWLRNRYRYGDISVEGIDDGWGSSYWYYLWSSFKAYQFLVDIQATPTAGNIGVADIGKLPPTDAPTCASRQVHRDPATLPRIALFGTDGPGYYADETKRIYFDYAYSIMGYQCSDGYFNCNSAPGRWDTYAEQAYALLVLQRSVGGGCTNVDRDDKCDQDEDSGQVVEPPVPPGGGLYCDSPTDNNALPDQLDLIAMRRLLNTRTTPATRWADYYTNGVINAADWDACLKIVNRRDGAPPLKSY